MKLPPYWKRFLFIEIIVVFICFFSINLLLDFMNFSASPGEYTPAPYFQQVFLNHTPADTIFVKKYWTQILFFLLVFFGQIAIFRQRKRIFTIKPRQNG